MTLDDYLARWADNRMGYTGGVDCAAFAAGWAGVKLGQWASKPDALRAVRAYGVDRLSDAVSCEMGEPIDVWLARKGDVVCLDDAPLDPLGICLGSESVFLGDQGLTRRKTRQCFKAWRV
jgi:hypothetical protein